MFSLKNQFKKMLTVSLILLLMACNHLKEVQRKDMEPQIFQKRSQTQLNQTKESSPFLKVHMQGGNAYVLKSWDYNSTQKQIDGAGTLYSAMRDTLKKGQFHIGLDSVAIIETNKLEASGSAKVLTALTVVTSIVGAVCLANPKACFGSCPTFYVKGNNKSYLAAEGFSSSISPSLEDADVDALFHAKAHGGIVEVEMRNEALETHVVRHVKLLAAPRQEGNRILKTIDGDFWESNSTVAPAAAVGPEGDCLSDIAKADNIERFSEADSTFLAEKEVIELNFENLPPQKYGLTIGSRQTLLSTYLLYQTYAYMGNNVGYWLAQIERQNFITGNLPIKEMMGGIDILVQDSLGYWVETGTIDEAGPLATDFHLVPFEDIFEGSKKVRLRMTKGNWRIDYVALAGLRQMVKPVTIQPSFVLKEGIASDSVLTILRDSTRALTTLPGDAYKLYFQLPDAENDYELFLESRGYYLEWIRQKWIEEENAALLAQMFWDPHAALTRLAPQFKEIETEMEHYFWSSRYAKP